MSSPFAGEETEAQRNVMAYLGGQSLADSDQKGKPASCLLSFKTTSTGQRQACAQDRAHCLQPWPARFFTDGIRHTGASPKCLPISTQTIEEPLVAISARTGAASATSELAFYKNVIQTGLVMIQSTQIATLIWGKGLHLLQNEFFFPFARSRYEVGLLIQVPGLNIAILISVFGLAPQDSYSQIYIQKR